MAGGVCAAAWCGTGMSHRTLDNVAHFDRTVSGRNQAKLTGGSATLKSGIRKAQQQWREAFLEKLRVWVGLTHPGISSYQRNERPQEWRRSKSIRNILIGTSGSRSNVFVRQGCVPLCPRVRTPMTFPINGRTRIWLASPQSISRLIDSVKCP